MMEEETLNRWGRKLLDRLPKKKGDIKTQTDVYFYCYYQFLKKVSERVDRNEDAIIAVGGRRGVGKSSFSLNSCLILKQMGIDFDWKNICHSFDGLGQAVSIATKSEASAHIVDEAIDVAMSRNAMTRVNKRLIQLMQRLRKKKNIWFWNIPRFLELDSGIRNSTVHFWVEVFWKSENMEHDKKFALAGLFGKDESPFTADPWGFDEIQKIQKRPVFRYGDKLRLMKRSKCFISPLAFPALPKIIENEYTNDSFAAIEQSGQQFEEELTFEKEKHIRKKNLLNQNEIE